MIVIMATEAKPRGPSAERVRDNIKAIRKERGLDLADVSERLDELGQPISVSGLSKIELGQRRVDVDDLVALALALDVSPSRLLLPGTADKAQLMLAPNAEATEEMAWKWAMGVEMLPELWADHSSLARIRRWLEENRPYDPLDGPTMNEFFDKEQILRPAVVALRAASVETGWTYKQTLEAVEALFSIGQLVEGLVKKGGSDGQHHDDGER